MKALPLLRNRQQLLHADAVVGIRTKTPRDPQELTALGFEGHGLRSVRGTVVQIAAPLVGEWRLLKALIGDVVERRRMIHSELPKACKVRNRSADLCCVKCAPTLGL
jgi:hypothetical protein